MVHYAAKAGVGAALKPVNACLLSILGKQP